MTRAAGVLCHISSLQGKYGIGNLNDALRFAPTLADSGVRYWQVLPLVQTGYGDSPYQSVSCTSGNPYFIDLDELGQMGLLTRKELKDLRDRYRDTSSVDYGALYAERYDTLRLAFSRYAFDNDGFRAFVKGGACEDYALFMTAKTVFGGTFCDWEEPLKRHEPAALEKLRTDHHEEYLFWHFVQYLFHMQWEELHRKCRSLGLGIIGDIPLYVAYDSADVWAHPTLFKLDEELKPVKVAGVPPDYFSATGQLWGNPVYDWKVHAADGYKWWTERLLSALSTYDLIRIDHFRGIDRYYEIDADAENAIHGRWVDGPKQDLFARLGKERERIVAEDLGIIDDGVRSLLKKTGFPGMKVLLFAFDGNPDNDYLPKNIHENSVCYTGTHDNETVKGYVDSLAAEDFILLRARLAMALEESGIEMKLMKNGENFPDAFIRLAMQSRAELAIVPIQDVLGLGDEARMNTPGTQEGNWQFRLDRPVGRSFSKLKKIIKIYRR